MKFLSLFQNLQIRSRILLIPARNVTSINVKSKWVEPHPTIHGAISSPFPFEGLKDITIPEFIRIDLHKFENKPALECGITGKTFTHGEIHKKSFSFGASLQQHGLKLGDTVSVLLPNVPEYGIVALGIWSAGMVLSPINPAYTLGEVTRQINDAFGKTLITLPAFLPLAVEALTKCPTLKSIIVIGENSAGGNVHSFYEMLKTDPKMLREVKGTDINTVEDIALLPCSSGTTGPPKSVMLTHSSFCTNLLQTSHELWKAYDIYSGQGDPQRFIAIMPFFHMYGLQYQLAQTLRVGAHSITQPKFDPVMYTKAVKKHKPTILHLVTPLMVFMSANEQITKEDLKHVISTCAGGAPVGPNVIDMHLKKFDHYVFYQEAYGMTEFSVVSHFMPIETKNKNRGSGGVLIPGTSCKIIDVETGEPLGPNKSGEICLGGPQAMKGYFNNEKATKESFDKDGYVKTGDIGYFDDQGFIHIVDRLKELIKVKGLQVAPAELENLLREHPGVADVAVIGVPHERLGEAPRAYVVPKSKGGLTEDSVAEFVKGEVSTHKWLVGGVSIVDAIPKSPSGKILRRMLAAEYNAQNKK